MLMEPQSPYSTNASTARRPRVLVVDDDEFMCRIYGRMLSRSYEVVTAPGGQHALDVLEADQDFDVILCDMMMPDIDGPGLHEVLLERAPDICGRMIFCSGGAYTDRAHEFSRRMADRFLEKPITREALLRTIGSMVDEADASS